MNSPHWALKQLLVDFLRRLQLSYQRDVNIWGYRYAFNIPAYSALVDIRPVPSNKRLNVAAAYKLIELDSSVLTVNENKVFHRFCQALTHPAEHIIIQRMADGRIDLIITT